MGEKDITLKSYLSDKERYADLWNGGIFGGKQVIKGEELSQIETELNKSDEQAVLERNRDMVMQQTADGKCLAVYALENQETVDYSMPVRIMLQEALEYDKQVRRIARENRNRYQEQKAVEKSENEKQSNVETIKVFQNGGEYLYGFRKQDKLYPVVTLVSYWGKKEWDGSKNLHEIIDFGETDTEQEGELKSFVNYLETHEECNHLEQETCGLISKLTNTTEMIKKKEQKEEKMSMCKAIAGMVNDEKAEGKAESILDFLGKYGELPEELKKKIMEEKDLKVLTGWVKRAAGVSGINEFVEKIQELA